MGDSLEKINGTIDWEIFRSPIRKKAAIFDKRR